MRLKDEEYNERPERDAVIRGLVLNRIVLLICLFALSGGGCLFERAMGADISSSDASGSAGQDDSARQLRIYSEALYQGSSEEVRVDAAIGLLLRKDAESRSILLKALGGSDNPNAQLAVCRALIQSRGLGSSAAPAEEFAAPLLTILAGRDEGLAKMAAEALLIYRFSEIEAPLTSLVKDPQRESAERLHGIYVLGLRTEPQALRILIQLLDDANPEIQQAAERALQEAFGIPMGTNRQVWSAILEQLRQKSPEDIRRERLLRQEMRLREVQEERDRWQRLYLAALDREYEGLDAAARGGFLLERMSSDLMAIRLWALGKVVRLSAETDPAFRERLLSLLADSEREVRLQTARVLTTMSALNPAEKLLEQYRQETDPRVALALFEALGEACYFAFSPGSSITLPQSIHAETLEIAVVYLRSEQAATAKAGAEVIRKLLELNGIESNEAAVYLTALLDRYQKTSSATGQGSFRGDLLMTMARLASQGPHKTSAGQLFRNVFLVGLEAKDHPEIRLAAVTGLVGLDKPTALKTFRERGLTTDPSPAIRGMIVDLAGQAGGREDLEWISSQLKNGSADSAWQAFRTICQRQNAELCVEWARRLEDQKAPPERTRQLWEFAEQKAQAENKETLLGEIQTQLMRVYEQNNEFAQILELARRMRAGGNFSGTLMSAGPLLVRAALRTQQWEQGAIAIGEMLKKGDKDSLTVIIGIIDQYMGSADESDEKKKALMEAINKTKDTAEYPEWKQALTRWSGRFSDSVNLEIKDKPFLDTLNNGN